MSQRSLVSPPFWGRSHRPRLQRGFLALLASAALMAADVRCAVPVASADWSKEMAAFATEDAAGTLAPGGVLFVGSSSIRLWKTLAADFSGVAVLNRGFGGSHIADSIVHFGRLVAPHKPRLVVFYAGTNDIAAGRSPEEVASDFREFCGLLHAALPDTRVVFISVQMSPLRWALREKFALANAYVAAFCAADPRRSFLHTNPFFLTADGEPRTELYSEDRLHMSPAGYAVWRRLLEPLLR